VRFDPRACRAALDYPCVLRLFLMVLNQQNGCFGESGDWLQTERPRFYSWQRVFFPSPLRVDRPWDLSNLKSNSNGGLYPLEESSFSLHFHTVRPVSTKFGVMMDGLPGEDLDTMSDRLRDYKTNSSSLRTSKTVLGKVRYLLIPPTITPVQLPWITGVDSWRATNSNQILINCAKEKQQVAIKS
jgi:hypothetical protein